ncbi:octanoyl-[acyl-carrier-protein]:protein N-octanoyltransferase LIPT2, mitochondrial-like [Cydia strobilella]|uniref:octanoyl-[acyl-carrier-protein]:protein N-octanoyltransferase LIPT2, mitochondrial-like n=1 Tax=Cydia strobilella TaxID=1100964 RepID=UPI00300489B2
MLKIWQLGLMSYDTALKIQKAVVRKQLHCVTTGKGTWDTLLLLEHRPVYTVGIRDDTPKEEVQRLNALGAAFRKTNRGGLITFHGPGQLVAYPIINLKRFKLSVKTYVNSLEQTVINVCSELGLNGERSPHTGVWIGDNKVAAIGVHATRYITYHGTSVNCDNDLSWFKHIDPCGIKDKGVTSLSVETGEPCSVDKITPLFIRNFNKVFNCESEDLAVDDQKDILSSIYNNLLVTE